MEPCLSFWRTEGHPLNDDFGVHRLGNLHFMIEHRQQIKAMRGPALVTTA
jgi:hypothetical protein